MDMYSNISKRRCSLLSCNLAFFLALFTAACLTHVRQLRVVSPARAGSGFATRPVHSGDTAPQARASRQVSYPQMSSYFAEHIRHTVMPYSKFYLADPGIAGATYLTAPTTTEEERVALRFFIDDYLQFHMRNRHNSSRYLIYYAQQAGMGDRLQQLIYAYFLAVVSNRVFLVDWQSPFPLSHMLTNARPGLDLFYDDDTDRRRGVHARDDRNSAHIQFMNGTTTLHDWDDRLLMSRVRVVVSKRQAQPTYVSEKLTAFRGPTGASALYLAEYRTHVHFQRAVLHHAFKLAPNVRATHTRMAKLFGLSVPPAVTPGYVGVHARLGKGVGEGLGRFGQISEKPIRAAKCLASRALNLGRLAGLGERMTIFLATDTPEFREVFRKVARSMGGADVRVVFGEWEVMHSNRMIPYYSDETAVGDRRLEQVMMSSYMDLVLLGHARHMVALYSSFPRAALFVGDSESITEVRNELCMNVDRWSNV